MSWQVLEAFRDMAVRDVDAWMVADQALRQQLEAQIIRFPSFALPAPDRAVCVCGLAHLNGIGEIWMITGEGFARSARHVLKQQQLLLSCLYDALGLHRLHMLVDCDRRDAGRWAEAMGFRYEVGPLRGMGVRGNDMDFYVYERKVA